MTPININLILAIAGLVLSAITFYAGRQTATRQDGKQDERDRDYISRLTCVEESAKSAHKRIDQLGSRHE